MPEERLVDALFVAALLVGFCLGWYVRGLWNG